MTQRERQASGGASATVPTLPTGPSRHGSPADLARPLPWEELFHATPVAQRGELLSLAQRQGLLFAHQIPAPANGARAAAHEGDAGARQILSALLHGQVGHLRPASGPVPALVDAGLSPAQREAVARALHAPDVCLVQGLPGTGKTRVVAEVVTQAALQGQRVLLLASAGAALDGVLGRVGRRDSVCAVRCLARDEDPSTLAPEVRPFLFAERVRALGEQGVAAAQRMVEQTEARCRQFRQEEAAWPGLRQLVLENQALEKRSAELNDECARAGAAQAEAERCDAGEPPRGDSPFARALRDGRAKRDAALGELGQMRSVAEAKRAEHAREALQTEEQLERMRPLVAAKEHGRWWSSNFWRATFRGDVAAAFAGLEKRHQAALASAREAEGEVRLLDEKCRQAEDLFRQQLAEAVAEETLRRKAKCDKHLAEWRAQQQNVLDRWEKACQRLEAGPRPARCDEAALEEARQAWLRARDHEQERVDLARGWRDHLRETAAAWPARLKRLANLVAATTAALPADEHFGDAAAVEPGFDLLVLEDAEQITESEFLKVARRARRWVLVAEPTADPAEEATHTGNTAPKKPGKPAGSPGPLRLSCFQRLWQHLHCDPSRLPYAWHEEAGRLCCRLIPMTAEQRQRLERESVVDLPEIELRILTLPGNRPLLAEVAFPATFTIQQAKEYIYRELQELPIQATGRCLRWEEGPEALVLRLADSPPRDAAPAVLEEGVHEWVGRGLPGREAPGPWLTCRVEFRPEAGWSRERAEEWIHTRLRLRDLGRTARLEIPWRMRPELAAVIWDLLYAAPPPDFCAPADLAVFGALASRPAVQFIAVPLPPRDRRPRDRAGPGRPEKPAAPALPRHGAGLELDLAGGRHTDLLPDELRPLLPSRGLVNYLEALAVVRTLEEMSGDAVLCATLARAPGGTPVGVLSPSPAQVELIRKLIERSAVLARSPLAVEVNVPAAFRHRECAVALVSLTRSHGHRAVTWADAPQTLALALTRARWQLWLFGDPGTLARRAGWQGPVDHLDEAAAERERLLLAGLVRYLQGQGAHRKAFHLGEGNGA